MDVNIYLLVDSKNPTGEKEYTNGGLKKGMTIPGEVWEKTNHTGDSFRKDKEVRKGTGVQPKWVFGAGRPPQKATNQDTKVLKRPI